MKSPALMCAALLILTLAPLFFTVGMLNNSPLAGLVAAMLTIGFGVKVADLAEQAFLREQRDLRMYRGSSL